MFINSLVLYRIYVRVELCLIFVYFLLHIFSRKGLERLRATSAFSRLYLFYRSCWNLRFSILVLQIFIVVVEVRVLSRKRLWLSFFLFVLLFWIKYNNADYKETLTYSPKLIYQLCVFFNTVCVIISEIRRHISTMVSNSIRMLTRSRRTRGEIIWKMPKNDNM